MKIKNPPVATNLMATARSFGNYDLAASLADLIDNSIKARSTQVDIVFDPRPDDVVVRIRDNGEGMDKDTLIAAMQPASTNPEIAREPSDLGRFGWGLKSASLAQARVLTVVSWCDGTINAARWDIDDIEDWGMELYGKDEALELIDGIPETTSGTEVIWTRSDRLLEPGTDSFDDNSLTHMIAHANQRLSLVFHRYLAGDGGQRLKVIVNGTPLQPVDPFMVTHNATQTLDSEIIGMEDGSQIRIQPYILPHFSKLTMEEQERLGGPEGMVRNQGFYVYRNRRLIMYGTWFRLVPHSELSQLTRVRVDLQNTSDADWRITVDKSGAQLPSVLKRRLRDVVKRFNRRSITVHRSKGVSLDQIDRQPVWLRYVRNGQVRYLINREHPLIFPLLKFGDPPGNVDAVFRLLESYFPTDRFLRGAALLKRRDPIFLVLNSHHLKK